MLPNPTTTTTATPSPQIKYTPVVFHHDGGESWVVWFAPWVVWFAPWVVWFVPFGVIHMPWWSGRTFMAADDVAKLARNQSITVTH